MASAGTSEPPRILLTGPPGCGKTTVILRILALVDRPAAGFYTEEVRGRPRAPGPQRRPGLGASGRGTRPEPHDHLTPPAGRGSPGPRTGFDVVALDGTRGPLARVGGPGPRVGRYAVDVRSFEAVGVQALGRGLEDPELLLVVDELGKMEFLSPAFRALLPRLFSAPNPLLGTVLFRPHPVADRYRSAPGVEVVDVTPRNRGVLPDVLAERFGEGPGLASPRRRPPAPPPGAPR